MGQCLCLKLYNWENHKENWIETGRKLMGFCSSHQDWWPWLGLPPCSCFCIFLSSFAGRRGKPFLGTATRQVVRSN